MFLKFSVIHLHPETNTAKGMPIKERIIAESTAMFTTHGLKSVRMDDIANTLGISKRTIYELFGDKENLIELCIRHFYSERNKHICETSAGARNIVEEILLNMKLGEQVIGQSFNIMNDLKKFYPKIYKKITEESYEEGVKDMKEKIERGIREGVLIPQIDVDMVIKIFTDIMTVVFERLNRMPKSMRDQSAVKTLRYCVIFFARGIGTQEGIKQMDQLLTENPDFL